LNSDRQVAPLSDSLNRERLVDALYEAIHREPQNQSQRTFCLAWDLITMVHGDGFEILFEQDPSLDDYGTALRDVGLYGTHAIIKRLTDVIPATLRRGEYDEALHQFLQANFEALKALAWALYAVPEDPTDVLLKYITSNVEDFPEYRSIIAQHEQDSSPSKNANLASVNRPWWKLW
jgi:hypothetical protein